MGLQFDIAVFREAVRAVTSESAGCEAMAVTANRTRARTFWIGDALGCDTDQNFRCDSEKLSIVPWGADRSALHVGRRGKGAVWHREDIARIPLD